MSVARGVKQRNKENKQLITSWLRLFWWYHECGKRCQTNETNKTSNSSCHKQLIMSWLCLVWWVQS
jgi:hypothetical protein